jgi:translation initiation factor 2 subunit 1
MTITVSGPEGIEVIKKALSKGLVEGKKHEKSTTEIYTLGSPRYKLRIVSPDYHEAEEILSDVLGLITKTLESSAGNISFVRK